MGRIQRERGRAADPVERLIEDRVAAPEHRPVADSIGRSEPGCHVVAVWMDQGPAEDAVTLHALHAVEVARDLSQGSGIGRDQRPPAAVRTRIEIGHQIVAFQDRREILVADPVIESEVRGGLVGVLQVEHHAVGVGLGHQCGGGLDPVDVAQQKVGNSVADIAAGDDVAAVGCLDVQVVVHGPLEFESHLERVVSSNHTEVVQQLEDLRNLELGPPF